MRPIAVLGLGYVGLPVTLAFARRFPGTIGFDVDAEKVARLAAGGDPTGAVDPEALRRAEVRWASDPAVLAEASLYVVAVPTPIDAQRRPDLDALENAARTLGPVLERGDVVVLESTVYPGATEEVLGPQLAASSGLRAGLDFKLAYSPERINPGDSEHAFERVTKVVAAQDEETLELVAACYGAVIDAGIHRAPSIRVAEAAKVIENVQRDLNIALVNELAMLFERMGIDTHAVLEAAATKWNFQRYRPGLVGGHCIGVDPYYLTSKAESLGFHPQVILAGRRINDGMGAFVAEKTVKLLAERGCAVKDARVAVLGLAYKPDHPDPRNSRVPDLCRSLAEFGVDVVLHDPLVEPGAVSEEYGLELAPRDELRALDALVLAVPHAELVALARELAREGVGTLVDVQGALDARELPPGAHLWRLG